MALYYKSTASSTTPLTGSYTGDYAKLNYASTFIIKNNEWHTMLGSLIKLNGIFANPKYDDSFPSPYNGFRIPVTGVYHMSLSNVSFTLNNADGSNIVWAKVYGSSQEHLEGFKVSQYVWGNTNLARICLNTGGITRLYKGEMIYGAISKSNLGYGDIQYEGEGVLTVTYIGQ